MSATCVVPPTSESAGPRRIWRLCLIGLLVLTAVCAVPALPQSAPVAPSVSAAAPKSVALPLAFVPNWGQTDASIRFQAHGAGGILFFSPQQVVLSMPVDSQGQGELGEAVVAVSFEGANSASELAGGDRLPGVVNYFLGDDAARWRTNLPTYRSVIYQDLYPGIDLHYSGAARDNDRSFVLKGTYVVAPGADPGHIRWRYTGSTGVRIDEASGDLHIGSLLVERAPLAWQVIGGRREAVGARYLVADDGSLGFALGRYDASYPLVLDPTLTYSTYLGGRGRDVVGGVAVDSQGNVYVTGQTNSSDFPLQDPIQPDLGGGSWGDVFVAKLDPTGSILSYATYIGGNASDMGHAIAVDDLGNAYVTGETASSNFPSVQAPQPGPSQQQDAFVFQLDAAGSALVYSSYLGGLGEDVAFGIAVDGDGNAYVTGRTRSLDFPTARAPQPDPNFGQGLDEPSDAFVTQVVSASGVYTWGYSTYLGGVQWDEGHAIAVDASGSAHVTGNTNSADFPSRLAAQPVYGGGSEFSRGDAFVTQIVSASGVYTWGYSTYLGGGGSDAGWGITLNSSGDAYVTGETDSTNFPTVIPFQADRAGGQDAFVSHLVSASGVYTWGYSTYLGGGGSDVARGIALDGSRRAYLTGSTRSSDFPATPGAYDPQCGMDGLCDSGSYDDAWLAVFNAAGSDLAYATYLGGSRNDVAYAVAVSGGGEIYLVGDTYSNDFPTSAGAFDSSCGSDGTCNGGFEPDAFIVKMSGVGAGLIYLPIVVKSPEAPSGCAPYLIATIGVGDEPRGIALDTPRNRAYVANYGSSSVSVIDTDRQAVITTLPGIEAANGIAYDAQHNRIWVSNTTSDQVTPIQANADATSFSVLPPVDVGNGPWGVAYDALHDSVYVVNNRDDSVTVVNAGTRVVNATLSGSFQQPFHVVANPLTGKVYVSNYGDASLAVIAGSAVSRVDLNTGDPSTQPYGLAVDETRSLVYVATVDSHRVLVIGSDTPGTSDQVLGWVALHRGFGDPSRPVPLRAIAVNPDIGPSSDGGHLWATTSTADGSAVNQALLITKGWPGFHTPVPHSLGASPAEGIAVDRAHDRVYLSSGTAQGTVAVLGDSGQACLVPFITGGDLKFEAFDDR